MTECTLSALSSALNICHSYFHCKVQLEEEVVGDGSAYTALEEKDLGSKPSSA